MLVQWLNLARALFRLHPTHAFCLVLGSLLIGGCETQQFVEKVVLDETVARLDERDATLQQKLDELEQGLGSFRNEASKEHQRLETGIRDEEKRRDDETARLDQARSALSGRVDGVSEKLEQHAQNIAGLSKGSEDLAQELHGLRGDVDRRFREVQANLKRFTDTFSGEMNDLQRQFEALLVKLETHYNRLGDGLGQQYDLINRQFEAFAVLIENFKQTAEEMAKASDAMVEEGQRIIRELGKQTEELGKDLSEQPSRDESGPN